MLTAISEELPGVRNLIGERFPNIRVIKADKDSRQLFRPTVKHRLKILSRPWLRMGRRDNGRGIIRICRNFITATINENQFWLARQI